MFASVFETKFSRNKFLTGTEEEQKPINAKGEWGEPPDRVG
jgi:hypothetical protein